MLKKFIEFIFYSSIFIAVCAVAMCIETNLLLHLPLNQPGLYIFVFGASLVQYNLHYLVKTSAPAGSVRFNWSQKNGGTHLLVTGAGLLMIITGLFTFQLRHFLFLGILGVITSLYSLPLLPFANKRRIKDYGILKIITLVMLWTLVTVWLPASQDQYIHSTFLFIFIRRFIFIFILCLVFDIRDVEIDANENIRTIPVIAGVERAYLICYILLAAFVLLSAVQYRQNHNTTELYAMLASSLVTIVVVEYTKKNKSDIIYLTIVDGMMLLQALLVIIGSI